MSVIMVLTGLIPLGHSMAAHVPLVPVIMSVRRRLIDRIGDAALFSDLGRFCRFVIVLGSPPFRMGNKPLQRRFIHMA